VPETLPALLEIVRGMDAAGQDKVIAAIDAADREVGEDLLGALANPGEAATWLKQMPQPVQEAVARAAERFRMQDELDRASRIS
jgi:hypothetical protein